MRLVWVTACAAVSVKVRVLAEPVTPVSVAIVAFNSASVET